MSVPREELDKNEPPTGFKLEKAPRCGSIVRSNPLIFAILLICLVGVYGLAMQVLGDASSLTRLGLQFVTREEAIGPLVFAIWVAVLLTAGLQARGTRTAQPREPDFSRLSPPGGFGMRAEARSPGEQRSDLACEVDAGGRPRSRELTALEEAERLDGEDVARCLQICAPMTIATLLTAHAWPWSASVLDFMPRERRSAVLECMRRDPPVPAPAVLISLCEYLCTCAVHLHAGQLADCGWTQARRRVARSRAPSRVGAALRRPIRWMR
jgi:FlhB HrpN YscU SpaS Family